MSEGETDRQKLDRLATEHQRIRLNVQRATEKEAGEFQKHKTDFEVEDQGKTDEVFAWCKETLEGFKVAESYQVSVSIGPNPSRHFRKERADGVPYVSISIDCGDGTLTVLMARHRNHAYRLYEFGGFDHAFPTFETFKDATIEKLAEYSSDDMRSVIEHSRQMPR